MWARAVWRGREEGAVNSARIFNIVLQELNECNILKEICRILNLKKFRNHPVVVQFRGNRGSVNIIAQVIKCYKFCAIFAMRFLVECGNCENTGNSENDPRVYELLCSKQLMKNFKGNKVVGVSSYKVCS